jgi:hypothetical protein
MVRPAWHKLRSYLKNRAGGVAQVVECLPSKYEALSTTARQYYTHTPKSTVDNSIYLKKELTRNTNNAQTTTIHTVLMNLIKTC